MSNTKSAAIMRARVWDEPFAIKKLAYLGYKFVQGTVAQDWEHIDIVVEHNGKPYSIDVKRNDKSNVNSPNFCFTYVNTVGRAFDFKPNGYLFFIDEKNYQCYIIAQLKFQELLNTYGTELKNARNGKAKLIPISVVAQNASLKLPCDTNDIIYLQNT